MDPTEANFVVLERKFSTEIAELRAELRLEQAAAIERNDNSLAEELEEALRQSEELLAQLRHLRRVSLVVATTPGRVFSAEEVDALRYFGFNPSHATIQERHANRNDVSITSLNNNNSKSTNDESEEQKRVTIRDEEVTRPGRILHQSLSPGSGNGNETRNTRVQSSAESAMSGVQPPRIGIVRQTQAQPIRVSSSQPRHSVSPPRVIRHQKSPSPTRNNILTNTSPSPSSFSVTRRQTAASSSSASYDAQILHKRMQEGLDGRPSPDRSHLQMNDKLFVPLVSPSREGREESETDVVDVNEKDRRTDNASLLLLKREKTAEMVTSARSPISTHQMYRQQQQQQTSPLRRQSTSSPTRMQPQQRHHQHNSSPPSTTKRRTPPPRSMTTTTSPKKSLPTDKTELVNQLREDNLALQRQVALMQKREQDRINQSGFHVGAVSLSAENSDFNGGASSRVKSPMSVRRPPTSPVKQNASSELRRTNSNAASTSAMQARIDHLEDLNNRLRFKINAAAEAVGQLAGGRRNSGSDFTNGDGDDEREQRRHHFSPSSHLSRAVSSLGKIVEQGHSALAAARFLRAPRPIYEPHDVTEENKDLDRNRTTNRFNKQNLPEHRRTLDCLHSFADRIDSCKNVPDWVGVAPFIIDSKRGFAHSITGLSVNLLGGAQEENLETQNLFEVVLTSPLNVSSSPSVGQQQNRHHRHRHRDPVSQQRQQSNDREDYGEQQDQEDPILAAVTSAAHLSASRNRLKAQQQLQQQQHQDHLMSSSGISSSVFFAQAGGDNQHHQYHQNQNQSAPSSSSLNNYHNVSPQPRTPLARPAESHRSPSNGAHSVHSAGSANSKKLLKPAPPVVVDEDDDDDDDDRFHHQNLLSSQYLSSASNISNSGNHRNHHETSALSRILSPTSQQNRGQYQYHQHHDDNNNNTINNNEYYDDLDQIQLGGASPSLELATLKRLQEERDALKNQLNVRNHHHQRRSEDEILASAMKSNHSSSATTARNNTNNNSSSITARKQAQQPQNASNVAVRRTTSNNRNAQLNRSSASVNTNNQQQKNNRTSTLNSSAAATSNDSSGILSRIGPDVLKTMTPAEIEVLKRVALTQQLREDQKKKKMMMTSGGGGGRR